MLFIFIFNYNLLARKAWDLVISYYSQVIVENSHAKSTRDFQSEFKILTRP